MVDRVITKELIGKQDLLLGSGTANQERASGTIAIEKINAATIPFINGGTPFTSDDVHDCLVEVKDIADQNKLDVAANASLISALINAEDVPNGSFERADEVDGTLAEAWTRDTVWSGGTIVLDSADSHHGSKSVKFSSTGAGGGIFESEFIYSQPDTVYLFEFHIKSTVANVRNVVAIDWYDDDEVFQSTTTIYDDAATNPTSWTIFRILATSPAAGMQFKFKLTGCHESSSTVGSTWFDGVKFYRTLYLTTKGANIASANALDVDIEGTYHNVTGTTTITSFAAHRVGAFKVLEFDGVLTLTHHATNLILPNSNNIVTVAGDKGVFFEYAPGDWKLVSYQRNNHQIGHSVSSWELVSTFNISSDATIDITNLDSNVDEYLITLDKVLPSVGSADLLMRVGTGGGPTWDSGSNYDSHTHQMSAGGPTYTSNTVSGGTSINLAVTPIGAALNTDDFINGNIYLFTPGDAGQPFMMKAELRVSSDTAGTVNLSGFTTFGGYIPRTAVTAVRLLFASGNLASGTIKVYRRVK